MQRRKGRQLTPGERVEIWRPYQARKPIRAIGRQSGRPAMTAQHELLSYGGFTLRARQRSRPFCRGDRAPL